MCHGHNLAQKATRVRSVTSSLALRAETNTDSYECEETEMGMSSFFRLDVNRDGFTLLRSRLTKSLITLTVLFLAAWPGSRVFSGEQAPIVEAVGKGDCREMNALLKNGADPNSSVVDHYRNMSLPVLIYATSKGDTCAVRALVSAGANVNYVFNNGNLRFDDPLSIAIFNENVPLVRTLLDVGADPTLRGPDGRVIVDVVLKYKQRNASPKSLENMRKIREMIGR